MCSPGAVSALMFATCTVNVGKAWHKEFKFGKYMNGIISRRCSQQTTFSHKFDGLVPLINFCLDDCGHSSLSV